MGNVRQNEGIVDDLDLLRMMTRDAERAPDLYRPGPYWDRKSRRACKELSRHGLAGFRGIDSGVATSFGDNPLVDIRSAYRSGGKDSLKRALTALPLFKDIFQAQANVSAQLFEEATFFKNEFFRASPRVEELLSKYPLIKIDTTKGGCASSLETSGVSVSHHYLQLLDTLDIVMSCLRRDSLAGQTVLEIGGGFGANAHLMVDLFGARKVIYLDIAPNLYVGTQYLKSFYGEAVHDYRVVKNRALHFRDDDSLEIYCLLPNQIESVGAPIDIFHNAHSFVEMPERVVRNYAAMVSSRLTQEKGAVSLVTYDGFDLSTTLDPEFLATLFDGPCRSLTAESLTPGRCNYHFLFGAVEN
jgi:putative sugar O-methyltransferase